MRKFNPPGCKLVDEDYNEEDDEIDDYNPNFFVDPKKVLDFFNPPMSWRAYNNCRLQYMRYERAFAPVYKRPKFVRRVSDEVVQRIIDIITSPTNVQGC